MKPLPAVLTTFVLLTGATLTIRADERARSTSDGAVADKADPTAVAVDSAKGDRRGMAEFKRIYALRDGEVLKRIGPPFPECRMAYWRHTYPTEAKREPALNAAAQFIRFKDGEFNYWGGTLTTRQEGDGDLDVELTTILKMVVGIPQYLIEGDPKIVATRVSGDFVYREGATTEELIPRLSDILRVELKLPIKLTLREVVRRNFVAEGEYKYVPLTKNARGRIILGGRPSQDDPLTFGGGGSGNFDEFLKWLGNDVKFPILSEVSSPPKRLNWFCYRPDLLRQKFAAEEEPADAERKVKDALDIIAEQTGLTFSGRIRKIRIVVVEAIGQ